MDCCGGKVSAVVKYVVLSGMRDGFLKFHHLHPSPIPEYVYVYIYVCVNVYCVEVMLAYSSAVHCCELTNTKPTSLS